MSAWSRYDGRVFRSATSSATASGVSLARAVVPVRRLALDLDDRARRGDRDHPDGRAALMT